MDGLIKINDVCKIFGVSRTTVYRMIDDGRLPPPVKLGKGGKSAVVWRESVIKKALDDIMPSAD